MTETEAAAREAVMSELVTQLVEALAWEGGNVPQSVHLAHDERCSACNDAARWLARLRKAADAQQSADARREE